MVAKEAGSFTTHANYLRALASEAGLSAIGSEARGLASLSKRVSACPTMLNKRPVQVDKDQVRRSLTNAWGTELLLSLTGRFSLDDEVLRIANNWAVVQAYYVVYHEK